MTHEHTQADSGGPVVEWREYGEFLDYGCVAGVKLAIVSVTPGDARWKVAAADLIAQGISASRSEARTACEAAIRTWFVKAGWPDTSTDRALIRQMREALAPFAALAPRYEPPDGDDAQCVWHTEAMPTIGDLRRAAAALAAARAIEERTDG